MVQQTIGWRATLRKPSERDRRRHAFQGGRRPGSSGRHRPRSPGPQHSWGYYSSPQPHTCWAAMGWSFSHRNWARHKQGRSLPASGISWTSSPSKFPKPGVWRKKTLWSHAWGQGLSKRTVPQPQIILQRVTALTPKGQAPPLRIKNFSYVKKHQQHNPCASLPRFLSDHIQSRWLRIPFNFFRRIGSKGQAGFPPLRGSSIQPVISQSGPSSPGGEEVGTQAEVCGQGHRKAENETFLVWLLSSKLVLFPSYALAKFCIFRVFVSRVSLPHWFHYLMSREYSLMVISNSHR